MDGENSKPESPDVPGDTTHTAVTFSTFYCNEDGELISVIRVCYLVPMGQEAAVTDFVVGLTNMDSENSEPESPDVPVDTTHTAVTFSTFHCNEDGEPICNEDGELISVVSVCYTVPMGLGMLADFVVGLTNQRGEG